VEHGYTAGGSYKREIAAYELAKVMGFADLLPTTIERTHPEKGVGAMIEWVPGKPARDMPEAMKYDGKVDNIRAAVFDYILENVDRHPGNWMVKPDGKLVLIDHGYYLTTKSNIAHWNRNDQLLNNLDRSERIPDHVKASMRDKWPSMQAAMEKSGIEDAAIKLCKKRYDKVMTATRVSDFAGRSDNVFNMFF
jgi:predicted unusual protein kinase regulating ubiquinone biosynthesis (AarF/ABC1/UbiB family)